jgi:hypothetical protein
LALTLTHQEGKVNLRLKEAEKQPRGNGALKPRGPGSWEENPEHLAKLDEQYYWPFGARLRRALRGGKDTYAVERSHFGVGREGKSPMGKLRELGFDPPDEFAAFPVVLLGEVAMIWASKRVCGKFGLADLPRGVVFLVITLRGLRHEGLWQLGSRCTQDEVWATDQIRL